MQRFIRFQCSLFFLICKVFAFCCLKIGLCLVFNIDILLDVNECKVSNGGCEHQCRNTIGSSAYQCNEELNLNGNGKSCPGKSPAKLQYFTNFASFVDAFNE